MAKAKSSGLLRSGLIVSAMTMLSRVLGLVRDIVFSRIIGASPGADVFFIAFKIPNLLRRLFAEGAFAQAFVPVLSEAREKGTHEAVKALIDRVAGCLGLVLTLVTAAAMLGAPVVASIFAPGFRDDPFQFALLKDMLVLTFPYLLLISLTGLAGGILNSYDRFAIPAFTPVLLNVCLIGAAIVVSPYFNPPALALAWGVLVAGVVQCAFQLPFLWRLGLLPAPKIDWQYPGVKKILRLMGPAIFGVSVAQINLMLDSIIASLLPQGSVSWLYFSDRLVELPLGVFAIAIATIILPNLSRQHASENQSHFNSMLNWGLRSVLFIALPAAIALFILAQPIISTLFGSERFVASDIVMSSYSLQAYSLGLVAFMMIKVLAPGYFARLDTKTPVRIGIIAMASNMVFNVILVVPLHYYFQLGHVGLALATAASAFLNAGLLLSGLRKQRAFVPLPGWRSYAIQLLLANSAMAGLLLMGLSIWPDWYSLSILTAVLRLGALCIAGAGVYLCVLMLCGLRLKDLYHRPPKS